MRRTFILLFSFVALFVGMHLLKNKSVPEAPHTALKETINHTATKGAIHEVSHQRGELAKVQRPRPREDERSSDESDEIESLTSIYKDQETERKQDRDVGEEELSAQAENPSSPIPGVKISAWVSSMKNAVPQSVPDPRVGEGMRYFLNCLELKNKGVSPVEAKDCDALLTDRRGKN